MTKSHPKYEITSPTSKSTSMAWQCTHKLHLMKT